MKHQLSLRRLLLYVALFAVGLGLINFAFTLRIEPAIAQLQAFCFGIIGISLAVCCPVGYLIAEQKGEKKAATVALYVAVFGMIVSGYLGVYDMFGK